MRPIHLVGAIVVVLAVGAAWYWWREDPDLAAARALQAQLAALGDDATPDERRALREQMRASMDKLTDEQRRSLFEQMRAPFENQMRAAVDGYFALPENQRQAYLDQQIRAMEQRRAAMQQRFAQRPPRDERRSPGGPPRGDRPAGAPGGGPGMGGRGGGPGGGGREQRMLDNTPPVERAKNAAFFMALEKRRKELGMPEMPLGRR